jgi:sterol desaturase/sphingolipid hydroxylase (fatty acid hydroxylase superfamily)
MQTLAIWVYGSFVVMFVIEALGGLHSLSRKTFGQVGYAVTYLAFQTLFAAPVMGGLVAIALSAAFPQSAGAWSDVPFWLVFPLWFLAEEFCHYWVHRKAHEWPWL